MNEKIEEKDEEVVALKEEEIKEPEEASKEEIKPKFDKESWKPKTTLGKKVKEGAINDINEILDNGLKILEAEIIDALLPDLEIDLLFVGQSKGKFGGGQKRVFKQTQKKTQEGNKPKFSTCAVVGNQDGYVGIGFGKSRETVPAREKAIRNAKLNVIKIMRGCGDWRCNCTEPHTIPVTVSGRCGSVIIKLIPSPRGTGLKVEKECAKVLKLAGIKDVWSRTYGQTRSKINLLKACFTALNKLMKVKVRAPQYGTLGIVEGKIGRKIKEEVKIGLAN